MAKKTRKKSKKTKPKAKKPEQNPNYPQHYESKESPFGRPTRYRKLFSALLIEHMGQGNPFDTFGTRADVNVAPRTLYEWKEKFPDFLQAVDRGRAAGLQHEIDTMRAGIRGSLVRVAHEKVIMTTRSETVDGKLVTIKEPARDAEDQIVTEKTFTGASYGQHMHKYKMANMHNWRDKTAITGENGEPIMTPDKMKPFLSKEENVAKLEEMFREMFAGGETSE